jgi:alpha-glucosidase
MAEAAVWLPPGQWFEMSTGAFLNGGDQLVHRRFMLHEIPYYAKAGTILPMNPAAVRNLQTRCDTLTLFFVPGGDGQLSYYEDDGATSAYDREYTRTVITKQTSPSGDAVTITIAARRGQYRGMPDSKAYELVLPHNFPPVSVTVNGQDIGFTRKPRPGAWTYDGFGLETNILTEPLPCDKEAVITLRYSPQQLAQQHLLDGKIKRFRRFISVTDAFKYMNARYGYPANLSEAYLHVSQTPALITAYPERTVEYLQQFEAGFDAAMEQIENFNDRHAQEVQQLLQQMTD